MSICSQEKKNLVEDLGLFFQARHKFPPLAARIYSILVLTSHDGYTFEDLMEITQNSKSSVSTNLNLLVSLKFVEYYTKTGNRKRYFRSNGSYVKNMLVERMESVSNELKMVDKVNTFNRINNPEKYEQKGYNGTVFQSYLASEKENLEQAIQKINVYQINN
ncbi:GbsR/MarR family transcriptional regulator [Maribacter sp. ACAM166]|uniref:GbsR/MarR family transcriptional regulator n=1 Tax=Maribacter sp. ACAM166 TaxID=2508996 RepID=UPI0010FE3C42|nr:transcriptional regulator [Maribacter sp. ACAM166]TLP80933.1 transcriptional regulator [Maribacter sp. ACAM166]